ncbi:transposable element Tcb1 transposase [Trichonephila clavipes]|nr:transposable element Tcb1 transposase [Trichonephila clavipes]
MDDNLFPSHENFVNNCLQLEDITRMDWQAFSLNLNLLEHVLDILGWRVLACQLSPTCLLELKRALHDEWCNIPQEQIGNLILSMPKRCRKKKISVPVQRTGKPVVGFWWPIRANQIGDGESIADPYPFDVKKRESWIRKKRSRVAESSAEIRCQVIYSQFGLAIHQNDHQARRRFVEWAQNEIVVVPDFHKRILFSDEAHFWLNGYINKQNCRIWSEANPQVYVETPLHPEKLTVWCALWAGGILFQKR